MKPLIEPNGRPHINCAKCRVAVVLPSKEQCTQLPSFAKLVREDSVAALAHAEQAFSLGPREAKALVLHVTRTSGKCVRCGGAVASGISVCSCKSVNLDW